MPSAEHYGRWRAYQRGTGRAHEAMAPQCGRYPWNNSGCLRCLACRRQDWFSCRASAARGTWKSLPREMTCRPRAFAARGTWSDRGIPETPEWRASAARETWIVTCVLWRFHKPEQTTCKPPPPKEPLVFKVEAQPGVLFVSTVAREIRRNRWGGLERRESQWFVLECWFGTLEQWPGNPEQWPANHVAPACFGMFGYISGPVTTAQYRAERAERAQRAERAERAERAVPGRTPMS